jgi:hypothetical protein
MVSTKLLSLGAAGVPPRVQSASIPSSLLPLEACARKEKRSVNEIACTALREASAQSAPPERQTEANLPPHAVRSDA